MVRQRRRLGLLKMREARHIARPVLRHDPLDCIKQRLHMPNQFIDVVPRIHLHIKRHLVVPAPSGMQTLARLPDALRQLRLDEAVDILGIALDHELSGIDVLQNPLETRDDHRTVLLRDDALSSEHLRMCDRARDILPVHPLIEAQRLVKFLRPLILCLCKSSTPKLHNFPLRTFPVLYSS